jgi:hypothetical protein
MEARLSPEIKPGQTFTASQLGFGRGNLCLVCNRKFRDRTVLALNACLL